MATKKVSPPTNLSTSAAEVLRRSVLHLMVDANLITKLSSPVLAKKLSACIGKKVSRNNLAMALSGYRTTPAYIDYLSQLKKHLHESLLAAGMPVTVYTNIQNNQAQNKARKNPEKRTNP